MKANIRHMHTHTRILYVYVYMYIYIYLFIYLSSISTKKIHRNTLKTYQRYITEKAVTKTIAHPVALTNIF